MPTKLPVHNPDVRELYAHVSVTFQVGDRVAIQVGDRVAIPGPGNRVGTLRFSGAVKFDPG